MDPILQELETRGVVFMNPDARMMERGLRTSFRMAHDGRMACDAQPALTTVPSSGIPAFLTTFIDPKIIDIVFAPLRATQIVGGEVKKGSWADDTAMFETIEPTGEVSSYGDYNNNGVAGVNVDFPQRQSYHFQVIIEWGERELERFGLARVDLANRKRMAAVETLNRFQNKSYFYGVQGLQNYGLLNDPSLTAPIQPANVGGNVTWATKDANGIYQDIANLFGQLQIQLNGRLELTDTLVLAMSPASQVQMTKTNSFNVNVATLLKGNFPNLRVEVAPEYATTAGNLVQLIAPNMDGQQTAETAFTEKLRSHQVVIDLSAFKQKHSQGTWGTIIYRPVAIASMIGV